MAFDGEEGGSAGAPPGRGQRRRGQPWREGPCCGRSSVSSDGEVRQTREEWQRLAPRAVSGKNSSGCSRVLARLAAGLAGGRCGLALREGSGLALVGAGRFVELVAEALVLGWQVANPSREGLAVGTPDRFHIRILRSSGPRSCAGGTRELFSLSLGR